MLAQPIDVVDHQHDAAVGAARSHDCDQRFGERADCASALEIPTEPANSSTPILWCRERCLELFHNPLADDRQ